MGHTARAQSGGRCSRNQATRREILRRGGLALAGASGALGVLGGACAAPGQQAPQGAGAARPPVSVRVHARTGSEDEAFQQRLSDFNQQNGRLFRELCGECRCQGLAES